MAEAYESLTNREKAERIPLEFAGNSEAKRESFDPATLDKDSELYIHPPYVPGDMTCSIADLSGGVKSGSEIKADQDPKPYLPTGGRYGTGSFGGV